jgi:hypothetical protein
MTKYKITVLNKTVEECPDQCVKICMDRDRNNRTAIESDWKNNG